MSAPRVLVSPSLLACDFGRLTEEVQAADAAGADWLHVDVMDGHFVPNLTLGPAVVKAIRRATRLPLDVHLMLDHPERMLKFFLDAGSDYVTVHVEAPGVGTPKALEQALGIIRRAGSKAGLSVRPGTDTASLKPFAASCDLMLVMSVEPGFGGQAFMPEAVTKIRQVRSWFSGYVAVDGGIDAETGRACRDAGANVLVAGTSVFTATSYRDAIQLLRE